MDEFFGYSEPPFIDELKKYNSGRNDLQVSLGDIKFRNQETDLCIIRIYVDPELRNKGIGNEMLSEVMKLGREYRFRKIWLKASFSSTFLSNAMPFDELKNWYRRRGFEICKDYGDHAYMVCNL